MSAAPQLRDFAAALIVKPSSLGDIVHTLPAVAAIRAAAPHAQLRWVANTEWTPLLNGSPLLDEVIGFPRKDMRGLAGAARFWRWRKGFRALPHATPELVLDFQGLLRSALISRARGGAASVGLSDAREGARWFYDAVVPVDPAAHAVERYLKLAAAIGAAIPSADAATFPLPEGRAPQGWPMEQRARAVVIHPFSRGAGKSLPLPVLQCLCDALAPRPVVLVGVNAEPVHPRGDHIANWLNRTQLDELIWIMRQAAFCISVDSGPMHIAAAVNDRTLGLHTWSDPRRVGPWNPRAWVWKAGRIAHRPDFTPAECAEDRAVDEIAARAIAEFVIARLDGMPDRNASS